MYRSSGREKISILSSKRDIGDDLRKNRMIYLIVGFTDMHKQINGLAKIAEAKKPKELLAIFISTTQNAFMSHLAMRHLIVSMQVSSPLES